MSRLLAWTLLIAIVIVNCSTDEPLNKAEETSWNGHEVRADGQLIPKEDCIEGVIYYYYKISDRGYYTVALDSNTKVIRCDESNDNKRITTSIRNKESVSKPESKPDKIKSVQDEFIKYIEYNQYQEMKKDMESENYKQFKDAQEYFGSN
jgi:hypothetical protein